MPHDVAKPRQLPSPDGCQETFSARAHEERGPKNLNGFKFGTFIGRFPITARQACQ